MLPPRSEGRKHASLSRGQAKTFRCTFYQPGPNSAGLWYLFAIVPAPTGCAAWTAEPRLTRHAAKAGAEMATLAEKGEALRQQLGIAPGTPLHEIVSRAENDLGLTAGAGRNLVERIDQCCAVLYPVGVSEVRSDIGAAETGVVMGQVVMGQPVSPVVQPMAPVQPMVPAQGSVELPLGRYTMQSSFNISFNKVIAFVVFVGFVGGGTTFWVIGQQRISYYDNLQADLPFQTLNCTVLQSQWIETYNDKGRDNDHADDDRCFDRYDYLVVVPGSQGTLIVSTLEGPRTDSGVLNSPTCNGESANTACERCVNRAPPLPNGTVDCWLATDAMTSDAADAFECSSTACTKLNDPVEDLDRLYRRAKSFRTGGIAGTSIGIVYLVALCRWHAPCFNAGRPEDRQWSPQQPDV